MSVYPFEINYSYTKLPSGLIKIDSPTDDNCYKLKYTALGPEFELVSEILSNSSYINHITGEPFIVTSVLYREIIERAIVYLHFEDNDDIESCEIKDIDIGTLNYNLVKMISKNWIKSVL